MKKLSKLKLRNVENLMSENEMKHVVGGYSVSDHCYPDEFLFTCNITFQYSSGPTSTGSVCATSVDEAIRSVGENLKKQTGGHDLFFISCY